MTRALLSRGPVAVLLATLALLSVGASAGGRACGCGQRTFIEQFSLHSGRPLRVLARIFVGVGEQISRAATDSRGRVWLTATTGPALGAPGTAGGDPQPDSCSGQLLRFDPFSGATTAITTFPSGQLVGDAIPSPNAQRVAVLVGGFSTAFFNQHIEMIDMRTGHVTAIGSRGNPLSLAVRCRVQRRPI